MKICLLLTLLVVGSMNAADDVLHLTTGQAVPCDIEAVTDNIVTFTITKRLANGQVNTAKHTLKAEQVKFIDFGPIPEEAELLAKLDTATVEEIDVIWDKKYRYLHRPKSNAGKIGVALGYALLLKENDYHWRRALDLFDTLFNEAWDEESKNAGRQGRLRALMRLGNLDQAIMEARQLAAETEDPTILIEARYIVAQADFAKLKKLEGENPRWMEDDEILPERNRLYHATLDQFLWPYLFHGTKEEFASRGLLSAGEVYRFAGKTPEAEACFGDIIELYPNSEAALTAREFLQKANTPTPKTDDMPPTK